MKYYLCTISFRHELASFRDLISYAHETGFAGIELWGVHAEALFQGSPMALVETLDELQEKNMSISMISHYVNLLAPGHEWAEVTVRWRQLIALAQLFRTERIRIFAGDRPSATASAADLKRCADRLRLLAEAAYQSGLSTVIEFHPDTYFDTLESAHRLLQMAEHPGIRVNVDFLHVWESGCDPVHALAVLKPWIGYYHLKNVRDKEHLHLFKPGNVYSPSGERDGLVGLAEGALDYSRILRHIQEEELLFPAALEWFGGRPFHRLGAELAWLQSLAGQPSAGKAAAR